MNDLKCLKETHFNAYLLGKLDLILHILEDTALCKIINRNHVDQKENFETQNDS